MKTIPMTLAEKIMTAPPAHYAQAPVLAAAVATEMLSRLEWVTLQPAVILDVGCGTGVATTLLQTRYPAAQLISLDVANPMLRYAKAQVPDANYVCADALALPLANQSVDLIFANLLLPWCADHEKILREWRRVLRPDGLLMFSSFGPDTLAAWRSQLADFMLPNLLDMHEIGDAMTRTRFAAPVLDVENFVLNYLDSEKFLQELVNSHMLVAGSYELPETSTTEFKAEYEIVYGHAWGPESSVDHVADEFGTVNIPLASLRRILKPK